MRKILSVLVLFLTLATLLPGYAPGVANAQEEATPEPPMEEEMPGLEFDFPGAEALAQLDSYRYRIVLNAEGELVEEEGGMGLFTLEWEYTREPEATHAIYSVPEGSDVEETPCGQPRCEYIVIGSQSWTYDAESETWISELTGAVLVDFLSPDFFFSLFLATWPEDALLLDGHEDLGGVDTSHYRWEPGFEEVMSLLGEGALELEEMEAGIEELAFDLWQANELGYPAKFSFVVAGTDEEGKSGRVEVVIEVFDVNAPIVIEAPEGAAPQLDIPTPDDAEMLFAAADMVMYTTANSVEDTAAFYRQQMPAQGWEEEEESSFAMEDMVSLDFKKGDQTVNIFITAGEGGKTDVMASISTEEGEEESVIEEEQEMLPEGTALLEERCAVCHGLDRVTAASKTQTEWEATVERMRGKGADLTDDEAQVLIGYLAENYGP